MRCSSVRTAQGHVNPLLSQGIELARRGWRVTFASPNRMAKHIAAGIKGRAGELAYMDLGDCAAIAELHDALERAADHENYMESQCAVRASIRDACDDARRIGGSPSHSLPCSSSGAREMFHWSIRLHHCMYISLHDQLPKLDVKPKIVISDFATYAGFDIADTFGIPFSQSASGPKRERERHAAPTLTSRCPCLPLLALQS